jgi:Fe2+ transport system protein FeoA
MEGAVAMEEKMAATSPIMSKDGVSLSSVPRGEAVLVENMTGGHHFVSRLAALGFTPGARLTVVQNFGHGPLIVSLRDTHVALGRGEAGKILVRRIAGKADGR